MNSAGAFWRPVLRSRTEARRPGGDVHRVGGGHGSLCRNGPRESDLPANDHQLSSRRAFAPRMRVPALAVREWKSLQVTSDIPSGRHEPRRAAGCCMNAHSRLGIGLKDTVAVMGRARLGSCMPCWRAFRGPASSGARHQSRPPGNGEGFRHRRGHSVTSDGAHREEVRTATGGIGPDVVIVAVSSASAQK